MKQLHDIIREAIAADEPLMEAIGSRLQATCFEVSPTEQDNTPLPYIIVVYGNMQGQLLTKDDEWMPQEWQRSVSVEIAADSTNAVEQLTWRVIRAVARHVATLQADGEELPQLDSIAAEDIAWDWTKPCCFTHLTYQCTITTDDYEQS